MNWIPLTTLAAWFGLLAAPALAENYEVNLTRKVSNVYKVDGNDVVIRTRDCYVYAYPEVAILRTSGSGGQVMFVDGTDKCGVKAVYAVSKQKPGKYLVTVSRDDYNWYEVFGGSAYIKTSNCLSLALGEEAHLTNSTSEYGRVHFDDPNDCIVEGIFTKLRL